MEKLLIASKANIDLGNIKKRIELNEKNIELKKKSKKNI